MRPTSAWGGSVPRTGWRRGMGRESLAQLYADAAGRIVGAALVDRTAWERLAYLCDHFPRRLCGSAELDGAIRWAAAAMAEDGLENIHTEPVTVPHWVRGRESAELIEPVPQ